MCEYEGACVSIGIGGWRCVGVGVEEWVGGS